MKTRELSAAVGHGLLAGAIGTAAMTVSSTIEMKLRNREASPTPAKAAAKVLGVEPKGEQEQHRFANFVHWSYGTMWGVPRALLGLTPLSTLAATAVHFGMVWGNALLMLPTLKVAPPPTQWGTKELGIDGFHHAVYATASALTYRALTR